MSQWNPVLAYGKDTSILFRHEEHLSHKAQNFAVNLKLFFINHFPIFLDFDIELLVLGLENLYLG